MTCVCFVIGSDKWTSLERKLFNKALAIYSKDFIFVQKMVSIAYLIWFGDIIFTTRT